MRNIKLTLEYDGSRFAGWNQGKNSSADTICSRMTNILERMTDEPIKLFAAARTEPGVHARAQIVNFKTICPLSCAEIKRCVNQYLPLDIAVLSAQEMPERFHAALNAVSRTYIYHVAVTPVYQVFARNYACSLTQIPDISSIQQTVAPICSTSALDIASMQKAAALLLGWHDFQLFSTIKKKKSTEKELFTADITEHSGGILLTFRANDFLPGMARLLVGTLLDIGLRKREPDCIITILAGEERPSAPANPSGLFLQSVEY